MNNGEKRSPSETETLEFGRRRRPPSRARPFEGQSSITMTSRGERTDRPSPRYYYYYSARISTFSPLEIMHKSRHLDGKPLHGKLLLSNSAHSCYILSRPFDLGSEWKNCGWGEEGFRNEDTLCVARFIGLNGLDESNSRGSMDTGFESVPRSRARLPPPPSCSVNERIARKRWCSLGPTERIFHLLLPYFYRIREQSNFDAFPLIRLNALYIYIYIYKLFFGICSIIMNVDSRIAFRLWKYNSALTRNQ